MKGVISMSQMESKVRVVMDWALKHPGEPWNVSQILRNNGYDTYSITAVKSKAIATLRAQGYDIIEDNRLSVHLVGKQPLTPLFEGGSETARLVPAPPCSLW